jgi:hypothetical protein
LLASLTKHDQTMLAVLADPADQTCHINTLLVGA